MASIEIRNVPDDVAFSFLSKCKDLGVDPNELISYFLLNFSKVNL